MKELELMLVVKKYFEIPKEQRPRPVMVNASASCFVPKPFTPFQWDAQNTYEEFGEKAQIVKSEIKRRQVRFTYHNNYDELHGGCFCKRRQTS